MDLSNCKPVELTIDGGATVVVQAGYPPIVNGVAEERMRVGCGSATIGMFAKQWHGKVDEVVVVDDHITGVLSDIRPASFWIFPIPDQDEGAALDAGPLFPGRRARHRLGWHENFRSALGARPSTWEARPCLLRIDGPSTESGSEIFVPPQPVPGSATWK